MGVMTNSHTHARDYHNWLIHNKYTSLYKTRFWKIQENETKFKISTYFEISEICIFQKVQIVIVMR